MERGRTCGGCGGGGEGGGEGGGGGADGGAALGGGAAPLRNQPWQDAPRSPSCYTTTTSQRCASHSHFPPSLLPWAPPRAAWRRGRRRTPGVGVGLAGGLGGTGPDYPWYWKKKTMVRRWALTLRLRPTPVLWRRPPAALAREAMTAGVRCLCVGPTPPSGLSYDFPPPHPPPSRAAGEAVQRRCTRRWRAAAAACVFYAAASGCLRFHTSHASPPLSVVPRSAPPVVSRGPACTRPSHRRSAAWLPPATRPCHPTAMVTRNPLSHPSHCPNRPQDPTAPSWPPTSLAPTDQQPHAQHPAPYQTNPVPWPADCNSAV